MAEETSMTTLEKLVDKCIHLKYTALSDNRHAMKTLQEWDIPWDKHIPLGIWGYFCV